MLPLQGFAVTQLIVSEITAGKSKPIRVEGRSFHSLSYRYAGEISLRTEEEALFSTEDSVTLMPRGVGYTTEVLRDTRMTAIHFTTHENLDFRTPVVLSAKKTRLRGLFEALSSLYRVEAPMNFSSMAVFYEILSELSRIEDKAGEAAVPEKIRLARELLEARFTDPFFDITALSTELSVSTAYLRRGFGAAYGKSPMAHLKELRLRTAKNMLASEFLTVAEIAAASGYGSTGYFIEDFHKATGLSPGRYRAKFYGRK